MPYFTELFDPKKKDTEAKKSVLIKTQKPFKEFRAEVYKLHLAPHPCEIIDLDGDVVKITKESSISVYLWANPIILNWRAEPLESEAVEASFEVLLERIEQKKRDVEKFFGF